MIVAMITSVIAAIERGGRAAAAGGREGGIFPQD
jgi:hypothetical protein